MEYLKLSAASGNSSYGEKSESCIRLLHKLYPDRGLLPYLIDPRDGHLTNDHVTFGAMGDSYYECAPGPWTLTLNPNT